MPIPHLIGAYATLPATRPEQEHLYTRIAERKLGTGLEIPDAALRGVSPEDFTWFAKQLAGRFEQSVITTIPTTMGMQSKMPGFGLASTDEAARSAAIQFITEVREAAEAMNQHTGAPTIAALHIHSAPTAAAALDPFQTSLAELNQGDWSTRLIIEHCDAFTEAHPGEKRFLSLEDEITAAASAGIGITVNWGRSVLETHDANTPAEHLQQLVDARLLEGLMFSGIGEAATNYGPAWGDAHLPLDTDEPTSWLTKERVEECLAIAVPHAKYLGVKVQTPADRDVDARLDVVESIAELTCAVSTRN